MGFAERSYQTMFSFWLLGSLLLPACGGGGSSGAGQRDYFLFEDGDVIRAVNSANPRDSKVLVSMEGISGGVVNYASESLEEDTPSEVVAGFTYVKNGQVWSIQDIDRGNMRPVLVSSETDAGFVCSAGAGRLTVGSDVVSRFYQYELPGEDGRCHHSPWIKDDGQRGTWLPLAQNNDNVVRRVSLSGTTATQAQPSDTKLLNYADPGGRSFSYHEVDAVTGRKTPKGVLALNDEGVLLWYEGENYLTPRYAVAGNIDSIKRVFHRYDNSLSYFYINNELRTYVPGERLLGANLMPTGESAPRYVGAHLEAQGSAFYFLRDDVLYQFDGEAITEPKQVVQELIFSKVVDYRNATDGKLVLLAQDSSLLTILAVEVSTGETTVLLELNTMAANNTCCVIQAVNNGMLYYEDHLNRSSGVVSLDGRSHRTFPETAILGAISSSNQQSAQQPSHLLLARYVGNNQAELTTLDLTTSRLGVSLGLVSANPNEVDIMSATRMRDKLIFQLQLPGQVSTGFWADINKPNSLFELAQTDAARLVGDLWAYWHHPTSPFPAPLPGATTGAATGSAPRPAPVPAPAPFSDSQGV